MPCAIMLLMPAADAMFSEFMMPLRYVVYLHYYYAAVAAATL